MTELTGRAAARAVLDQIAARLHAQQPDPDQPPTRSDRIHTAALNQARTIRRQPAKPEGDTNA